MSVLVNNYRVETYFQYELISLLIFSVLSIYLDQVFPNEFGQKKHPLFFIKWIWQKNNKIYGETFINHTEVEFFFYFLTLLILILKDEYFKR